MTDSSREAPEDAPAAADPRAMSPRRELAAAGAVAAAALVLEAAALALGLAATVAPGVLAALAACVALAAAGLMGQARAHAATRVDPLTGLPNTAQLREDVAALAGARRHTLLIFDLVGFKKYNDAFGFACGDALLRRLGRKLVAAINQAGAVYRLRGGQFAVLTADEGPATLRLVATDALVEVGEGFMIRCATGAVVIPDEATGASEALKLADQEVQAERAMLRQAGIDDLSIAAPALAGPRATPSPYDVAELSVSVGRCLGLSGPEQDHLASAAALRDVGMMSVPEAIVQTPGRLTDEDWRFVGLHTLAGERLLRANFGMDAVAAIVRSSHERWDGGGYPDGHSGEDIPLAARILFVCSAFQDMTTQRPHRPALTAEQALCELHRCAGTQFDPAVVAAFAGVFGDSVEPVDGAVGHVL
jgi:diguanylate cyclase (GGDEF)-like protein